MKAEIEKRLGKAIKIICIYAEGMKPMFFAGVVKEINGTNFKLHDFKLDKDFIISYEAVKHLEVIDNE